jgi:uncharacterized protein with HEPN domain
MPPDNDDRASLWDMLTAAKAVMAFVQSRTLDDYVTDLMLRSAVERQVEIIGEAARRVSKVFREAHAEIPWRPIQAQRHVLAHEYGEIKHDRLWRVATIHIPDLVGQLEPLVPNLPPSK